MPSIDEDKVMGLIAGAIVAAAIDGLGDTRVLVGMDRKPRDLPREITALQHWVNIVGLDLEPDGDGGKDDPDTAKLTVRMVLYSVGPESDDQREHYAKRAAVAAALKDKGLQDAGSGTTVNLDRSARATLEPIEQSRNITVSQITASGVVIGE